MSNIYRATEVGQTYFITLTTVGWVDVFTRLNQKYIIIEALKYCQKSKGLTIFSYCLMSSHLHLICRANAQLTVSEIMRDFKKYTSKKVIEVIKEEPESRREWILKFFKDSCQELVKLQNYKVWQDGYYAKKIFSYHWIKEKINYIHQNPVTEKIVIEAEAYYFSSARNYAGLESALEIEVLSLGY